MCRAILSMPQVPFDFLLCTRPTMGTNIVRLATGHLGWRGSLWGKKHKLNQFFDQKKIQLHKNILNCVLKTDSNCPQDWTINLIKIDHMLSNQYESINVHRFSSHVNRDRSPKIPVNHVEHSKHLLHVHGMNCCIFCATLLQEESVQICFKKYNNAFTLLYSTFCLQKVKDLSYYYKTIIIRSSVIFIL